MSVDGNLWYVKLADGDVERVTLDQLDDAFQSGQIDESSMVLAAGSDKWEKLSDLLGQPEATAPAPAPVPSPPAVAPARALAPAPAPAVAPQAHAVVAARAPIAAPAVIFRAPMPVAAPFAAPMAAASLRPVSVDLGILGGDETPFRSSSKKRWAVGGLAAVALAGVGAFFVMKQTSASAASDPPPPAFAAAAMPPPVAETPPTPTPAAVPAMPQPMANGPSSVMDPTQRLNDDTRQKLMETDKKLKRPKGHAMASGGGGGSHSSGKDKSSGFTTGGNKYDPLNSSL
jgi:hypothetical protein